MEDGNQTIVHLNSHGSAALGTLGQRNNRFINLTASPIKDISRIGLQYTAIPRLWDTVHKGNNSFVMYMDFVDGNETRIVECYMPEVNYYTTTGKESEVVLDDE